ncbi:MAG: hypothetical protein V4677_15440 [Bacteroidota bacterium]
MKNYKILEDRPELSSKELTEGMDFANIKTQVAAAKMISLKIIVFKVFLSSVIITSGLLIYKHYTSPVMNNTVTLVDPISKASETPQKSANTEANHIDSLKPEAKEIKSIIQPTKTASLVDTIKANTISIKTTPSIVSVISVTKEATIDTVVETRIMSTYTSCINNTKQTLSKITSPKTCKIWQPNDFCTITNTQPFNYTIDCDVSDYDHINCATVYTSEVTCVLLTLTGNGKQHLKIENKLKNIVLINAISHTSQAPIMIGIGNDNKFLGANFKAKKFLIAYNKQIDIYLFFKKAKPGDKVIINNFIEAIIEP